MPCEGTNKVEKDTHHDDNHPRDRIICNDAVWADTPAERQKPEEGETAPDRHPTASRRARGLNGDTTLPAACPHASHDIHDGEGMDPRAHTCAIAEAISPARQTDASRPLAPAPEPEPTGTVPTIRLRLSLTHFQCTQTSLPQVVATPQRIVCKSHCHRRWARGRQRVIRRALVPRLLLLVSQWPHPTARLARHLHARVENARTQTGAAHVATLHRPPAACNPAHVRIAIVAQPQPHIAASTETVATDTSFSS
ncbi:hypothetical protein B0H16DRAFT_1889413 [Mycena metata]|uniref:Uncharacterized protein n=1 Tax=Mycena metata TaxID=1033252 RepID=A0AAD7IKP0_9AGAR|nr:hypothetical protein B0H16DRAFT_1889413 [Mycena metata]